MGIWEVRQGLGMYAWGSVRANQFCFKSRLKLLEVDEFLAGRTFCMDWVALKELK